MDYAEVDIKMELRGGDCSSPMMHSSDRSNGASESSTPALL